MALDQEKERETPGGAETDREEKAAADGEKTWTEKENAATETERTGAEENGLPAAGVRAGAAETAAALEAPRKSSPPWPWIAIALLAVAALIFVLVRGQDPAASGGADDIVGVMEGATFTKADLYDEMVKQMGAAQVAAVLENLMVQKMIGMEAAQLGIKVGDADIEADLERYKQNFSSEEEFNYLLEMSGISLDALKEQIRTSLQLRKIFELAIKPEEEQLRQFYEENKSYYGTPEQVRASHILLETKEEAEAVLAELKQGADFAALAKERSLDPGSRESGGDLDYFTRGVMNEAFEEAAFSLNTGELSDVVESPYGFHIIKLTDRKPEVIPPYEEVKELVKNDYLDQEIQSRYDEWLESKKKDYGFRNMLEDAAK